MSQAPEPDSDEPAWFDSAESFFRSPEDRIIGTVATWVVTVLVAVWLEVWKLFFRAVDVLREIPATLESDLSMMLWTVFNAFLSIIRALELVLLQMVWASGPLGWLVAVAIMATLLFAIGFALRVAIRVIPFL